MADTSERIIILSAVVLVIIAILPNSGLMRPLGTVFDLEVEITTSRDNYTLGESFTATLHLMNNGSKDVWLNPIIEVPFIGNSVSDPEQMTGAFHLDWPQGHMIHVPPKSKFKLVEFDFKPKYSGEFVISCFGVKKSVLILEPEQGVSVETWGIEDLLYPELALSYGFKGYINISYVSETPVTIIVSPGKVINYTIQLKLIPHVPEFIETEVLLDPENASGFGVGWGDPVPIFNNYIRYSPNGSILLLVDEPRNITMILSVPEGFNGMSAYPRHLLHVGIMADIPVASASGAGLDIIPRDEG